MVDRDESMVIRPATVADAEVVARLGAETFMETFGHLYTPQDLAAFLAASRTASFYADLLRDPAVFILLAVSRADERAIGYAVAGNCKLPVPDLERQAGEVRELYVLAEFQKHKLGTKLLTAALDWLDAQQRTPLYVGVWSGNEGAQRLYARFGFEKVGEYGFAVGDQVDREYILKRMELEVANTH